MSEQQCPKCGTEHAAGDVIACFASLNTQIEGDWQAFLGSGFNVMTAIGYYDADGKVVFLADCAPDWFYKADHNHLSDHRKMLNWILMAREALPSLTSQLSAAESRIKELEQVAAKCWFKATAAIEASLAQVERLREALEPFAKGYTGDYVPRVSDYKHAADLLATPEPAGMREREDAGCAAMSEDGNYDELCRQDKARLLAVVEKLMGVRNAGS